MDEHVIELQEVLEGNRKGRLWNVDQVHIVAVAQAINPAHSMVELTSGRIMRVARPLESFISRKVGFSTGNGCKPTK